MEPKNYLVEKLGELASHFPHVQVKYAYNELIETHIVELSPEQEYYNNSALDDAWFPISIEFMETFPEENISFVSSDSSLNINKPEYEWNTYSLLYLDNLMANFFEDTNLMKFQLEEYTFPEVFYNTEKSGQISLPKLIFTWTSDELFQAGINNLEVSPGNTANAMAA